MNAVREWYEDPAHIGLTPPDAKAYDRSLLARVPLGDVLNLGPDPIEQSWAGARSWTAVDFSWAVLAACWSTSARYVQADIRALPFRDATFDTVADFSTGDHVEHGRDRMRDEVYRVLRPGGHYVITYPNAQYGTWRGGFGYAHWFIPEEILSELRAFRILWHDTGQERSGIIAQK